MANASAISLDRMVRAVEKVRERLLKAVGALEAAGIPYAVAGGNAVAAWVSTVDEAAVRNTRDVDMMLRRADLERARTALEGVGFFYRHTAGLDVFLDGPDSSVRDAVHIVFANEMVRPHEPAANPELTESERADEFVVLSLEALVRIKLTAYRDKDRTHLRDLIEVGLVDRSWIDRLPKPLAVRLQAILDDPLG
jgi:hypothetical protein